MLWCLLIEWQFDMQLLYCMTSFDFKIQRKTWSNSVIFVRKKKLKKFLLLSISLKYKLKFHYEKNIYYVLFLFLFSSILSNYNNIEHLKFNFGQHMYLFLPLENILFSYNFGFIDFHVYKCALEELSRLKECM